MREIFLFSDDQAWRMPVVEYFYPERTAQGKTRTFFGTVFNSGGDP
jgi:hypothetical protein